MQQKLLDFVANCCKPKKSLATAMKIHRWDLE